MKTQTLFIQNYILKNILFTCLFMISLLASNPVNAQTKISPNSEEKIVKGTVKDETGPIEGVTILLKDTNIAVNTDEKGMFTFPQKLKVDDELVIIHLGYKNQEIVITPETSFIDVTLTDYDITIMGSLMIGNNSTTIKD